MALVGIESASSPSQDDIAAGVDASAMYTYVVGNVAQQSYVDQLVAAIPPDLTFAHGTLAPGDNIIIPAVAFQVIRVYGFVAWAEPAGAYQFGYTNPDGTNFVSYQSADLNLVEDGMSGVRSSLISLPPGPKPIFTLIGNKAFAANGEGSLNYMIWYTQG